MEKIWLFLMPMSRFWGYRVCDLTWTKIVLLEIPWIVKAVERRFSTGIVVMGEKRGQQD